MNDLNVIATLNQHLLNKATLADFIKRGVTHFRINGSHVLPADIKSYVAAVREHVGHQAKILIDLPGNKIRTANISQPIPLQARKSFTLRRDQFNFPGFVDFLKPGDTLLANDSRYLFTVEDIAKEDLTLRSETDGALQTGKGVHLTRPHPELPIFFQRDLDLVSAAKEHGVDVIGLSFVRTADDVVQAKKLIEGSSLSLIVKVETAPAVKNLDEILGQADEFLVDRGDLSCDIGLENIEKYQKYILKKAKARGKKVYFATQFLCSMLETRTPLIAEVCGLTDALDAGVDGIQLSEETAVGKYPLEVLDFVRKINSLRRPALKAGDGERAPVLWLTGRSGAGKTTIAVALKGRLESLGFKVALIDGDEFRDFFANSIGYTKEDRILNQKNIAFAAFQAARSFDIVIVSSLSPYREMRSFARERLAPFAEVYVDCPLDSCRRRDPKGHYQKVARGEMKDFIAKEDDYEVPENPELVLNTEKNSVEQSVERLLDYLLKK